MSSSDKPCSTMRSASPAQSRSSAAGFAAVVVLPSVFSVGVLLVAFGSTAEQLQLVHADVERVARLALVLVLARRERARDEHLLSLLQELHHLLGAAPPHGALDPLGIRVLVEGRLHRDPEI